MSGGWQTGSFFPGLVHVAREVPPGAVETFCGEVVRGVRVQPPGQQGEEPVCARCRVLVAAEHRSWEYFRGAPWAWPPRDRHPSRWGYNAHVLAAAEGGKVGPACGFGKHVLVAPERVWSPVTDPVVVFDRRRLCARCFEAGNAAPPDKARLGAAVAAALHQEIARLCELRGRVYRARYAA